MRSRDPKCGVTAIEISKYEVIVDQSNPNYSGFVN